MTAVFNIGGILMKWGYSQPTEAQTAEQGPRGW